MISKRLPTRPFLFKFVTLISIFQAMANSFPKDHPNLSPFAFSLLSNLSETSPPSMDILFSPYSIASSLCVAAAGTPLTEITETLGLGMSHKSIYPLHHSISTELASHVSSVNITSHTSLWTKCDDLKPSYISTVKDDHLASVKPLPKRYETINDFISNMTNGELSNVMEEGDVDPLTVALIVSAIKFVGRWEKPFNPEITVEGEWERGDGRTGLVKYMRSEGKMKVHEWMEGTMIRLDYSKNVYALFALPRESGGKGINDLVDILRRVDLKLIIDRMHTRLIDLSLPRFRIEYGTVSLKTHLKRLGITQAFSGTNVFSKMTDDPDVHLDDVLHKVVMEVTEEGTTATAATVGVMKTRGLPEMPLELRFDRPFLMIVWDSNAGAPLFVGKIAGLGALAQKDMDEL